MKRSPKSIPLINETNHFCGVALQPLGAAEQEHGLDTIEAAFGISADPSLPIHQRHAVTTTSKHLVLVESDTDSLLVFCRYASEHFKTLKRKRPLATDRYFPYDLPRAGTRLLGGAWSDRDFGIHGVRTGRDHVRQLFAAFQNLDVSIFMCNDIWNPVWRHLCIVITSKVPYSFWPGNSPDAEVFESFRRR